jgi:hypothetical protein
VVTDAVEGEVDATVAQPLAVQTLGEVDVVQDVDGPLLKHSGADPLLDVGAAARLEDDRVDGGALKQTSEQQPGGPGPDDHHLCPLAAHVPSTH